MNHHNILTNSRLLDSLFLMAGSAASLLIAITLTVGTNPLGMDHLTHFPLTYEGDGLFATTLIQRTLEGNPYSNDRMGYPFGSAYYDFPAADIANYLMVAALGKIGPSNAYVLNAYILLSFVLVYCCSYVSARCLGVGRTAAACAAVIYTFLPFHFLRFGHTWYLAYFVVPVYFTFAYNVFTGTLPFNLNDSVLCRACLAALLCVTASFGAYYALFGSITVLFGGLCGVIGKRTPRPLADAAFWIFAISLGVFLNLTPSITYSAYFGPNDLVANRFPGESETYGLKLIQLLLPRPLHRIPLLANITQFYNSSSPVVNENSSSAMGLIGSVGLVLLGFSLVVAACGQAIDVRLRFCAIVAYGLVLTGTVGGLGTIFAYTVSPSIRAWNRISVFIAFPSIIGFFLLWTIMLDGLKPRLRDYPAVPTILTVFLALFGLWDQTVLPCIGCAKNIAQRFMQDSRFINEIEMSVDRGGAVYQLPYMPFPEVPARYSLSAYDLSIGFLHSAELRWSFGGMKGRAGDHFYNTLSGQSPEQQVRVLHKMGFAGIYIDGRGYEDKGNDIIAGFASAIGAPPLIQHQSLPIVFFALASPGPPIVAGTSTQDIVAASGLLHTANGDHADDEVFARIDFTQPALPAAVAKVSGLSVPEAWGRWTDAGIAPRASITFVNQLPRSFRLCLDMQAFGPNANAPFLVEVLDRTYSPIAPNPTGRVELDIDLGESVSREITITPARPISPKELGVSDESRRIGLGFRFLTVIRGSPD